MTRLAPIEVRGGLKWREPSRSASPPRPNRLGLVAAPFPPVEALAQ
jgi:hypothetical protein